MISSIVDNEGKLDLLPEYPKSSVPSAHEIRILEEVREALAPAVEFTKLQEKGSSTSGLLLCGLKMLVKKLAFDCSDLCKTFSNIVAARFSDPCSDPFYKIAALLDPRCCYFYKDNAEYRELLNSAIGVVQLTGRPLELVHPVQPILPLCLPSRKGGDRYSIACRPSGKC